MRRTSFLLALVMLVGAIAPTGAAGAMREISSIRVSKAGGLGRIEVRKDLAAVLQRDEGIVAMVDVADPRHPKVLGRYDDGAAQSLDGDLAFSADGRFVVYARQTVQFSRDGIHVIDVTDPKNPTLRSYSPGGGAYRVLTHSDESGEYVLLLDAVLGLVVYRLVEGVLVPVYVDALPALKVGGPASAGMEIVGDRLYVTTGETGLQVYDFANPVAPSVLGSWTDEGLAEIEIVKEGKRTLAYGAAEYWFDAANENEIVVLDVSDPASIRELDRWSHDKKADESTRLQGLEWRGGILYAAHSGYGLIGFKGGHVVERFRSDRCVRVTGPGGTPGCLRLAPIASDVDQLSGGLVVSDALGMLYVVSP